MVVYRVQAEFGTTGLSITAKAMAVAQGYPMSRVTWMKMKYSTIMFKNNRFPTDFRVAFIFKCQKTREPSSLNFSIET